MLRCQHNCFYLLILLIWIIPSASTVIKNDLAHILRGATLECYPLEGLLLQPKVESHVGSDVVHQDLCILASGRPYDQHWATFHVTASKNTCSRVAFAQVC